MELGDLSSGRFEVLAAHASVAEQIVRAEVELRRFNAANMADSFLGDSGDDRYGYRNASGAALIPVTGALIPRGPVGLHRYGATSYEALRSELRRATADTAATSIIMMIDSGGGYVTGVDVTGDAIQTARRSKPVIAVVEGNCFSAAYWLASQCDAIIMSSVSEVGSIGVLLMHVDVSKAMTAAGLKVTYIHAGARKVDANPFEPLPDAVKASLGRKVEASRQIFAAAVVDGRARSDVDLQAVLRTEASVYGAGEAIAIGLADRIGSLDQVLDALPTVSAMRRPMLGAGRLADAPIGTLLEAPSLPAPPPAPAAILADLPRLPDPVGPTAERARIAAILGHEFAQGGCRAAAEHIAFNSDLPLEQAIRFLEINAETIANNAASQIPTLAEEMAADIQPRIGIEGGMSLDSMTPAQRGAVTAAILFKKDPVKAAAAADGGYGMPRLPDPPDIRASASDDALIPGTAAWARAQR